MFDVRSQTVAASAVAPADLAEQPACGRAADLAGAFAARHDPGLRVRPDTETMSGVPGGALRPGPGATIAGPSYTQWPDSDDAARLAP